MSELQNYCIRFEKKIKFLDYLSPVKGSSLNYTNSLNRHNTLCGWEDVPNPKKYLCFDLNCKVLYILSSHVTRFSLKISRNTSTLIFLFLMNYKFSDANIFNGSWLQWMDKIVKVSSQTVVLYGIYTSDKRENLAWDLVW
jgi:hypothetical protein